MLQWLQHPCNSRWHSTGHNSRRWRAHGYAVLLASSSRCSRGPAPLLLRVCVHTAALVLQSWHHQLRLLLLHLRSRPAQLGLQWGCCWHCCWWLRHRRRAAAAVTCQHACSRQLLQHVLLKLLHCRVQAVTAGAKRTADACSWGTQAPRADGLQLHMLLHGLLLPRHGRSSGTCSGSGRRCSCGCCCRCQQLSVRAGSAAATSDAVWTGDVTAAAGSTAAAGRSSQSLAQLAASVAALASQQLLPGRSVVPASSDASQHAFMSAAVSHMAAAAAAVSAAGKPQLPLLASLLLVALTWRLLRRSRFCSGCAGRLMRLPRLSLQLRLLDSNRVSGSRVPHCWQ